MRPVCSEREGALPTYSPVLSKVRKRTSGRFLLDVLAYHSDQHSLRFQLFGGDAVVVLVLDAQHQPVPDPNHLFEGGRVSGLQTGLVSVRGHCAPFARKAAT